MDIRKVKKLIEMMEESDISEIEIKEGEDSVRISRGGVVVPLSDLKLPEHKPIADRLESAADKPLIGHVVGAPMVGTFYSAASPSSPPFVETGDAVREGDTLCIIESMKMMNYIKAEQAGKIEAILVVNEEPVEFDQPLFTIS
ncbi:MAG: acetyl-CoA carboxylase biotin carboxyl carrier protein [Pseudomonadales bacterium]|jgi:acetyl-CoA carboxylase biotin carboxyl carrier protein|nr:acetyl-CoA carboxylase biotin carboxyl carrier protein [Pseudomonadales bacterium]